MVEAAPSEGTAPEAQPPAAVLLRLAGSVDPGGYLYMDPEKGEAGYSPRDRWVSECQPATCSCPSTLDSPAGSNHPQRSPRMNPALLNILPPFPASRRAASASSRYTYPREKATLRRPSPSTPWPWRAHATRRCRGSAACTSGGTQVRGCTALPQGLALPLSPAAARSCSAGRHGICPSVHDGRFRAGSKEERGRTIFNIRPAPPCPLALLRRPLPAAANRAECRDTQQHTGSHFPGWWKPCAGLGHESTFRVRRAEA